MHVFALNELGATGVVLLDVTVSFAAVAAYMVPSIVAGTRKVPNVGTIVTINLLLGWTVIGWIVALAMAMRDRAPVSG